MREMLNDDLERPIWGCRSLPPDTKPHLAFTFDPPPPPAVASCPSTTALLEAQRLLVAAAYAEAAELLLPLAATDGLARRLLLDCFGKLNDTAGITAHFDPPLSETEAIYLMGALWGGGRTVIAYVTYWLNLSWRNPKTLPSLRLEGSTKRG